MNWLREELDQLEQAHLYRRRLVLDSPQGADVVVDGERLLSFCSNDYLGLANDPRVVAALRQGAEQYGVGAGASHLMRVKKKAYEEMTAGNPHELMHCMEVLNLLDIGEIIFVANEERKETREKYVRIDHPYKNPGFDEKVLISKKGDKGPVTEWRELKK